MRLIRLTLLSLQTALGLLEHLTDNNRYLTADEAYDVNAALGYVEHAIANLEKHA